MVIIGETSLQPMATSFHVTFPKVPLSEFATLNEFYTLNVCRLKLISGAIGPKWSNEHFVLIMSPLRLHGKIGILGGFAALAPYTGVGPI